MGCDPKVDFSSIKTAMKTILVTVFLVLIISASGCSLFGWSENGMRISKPIIDRDEWTKPDIDQTQRKQDWISCGGYSGGSVHFTPLKHEGLPTTDDNIQADKEYDAVQACMMKKGYKFIGSCKGPLSGRLSCKGRSIFNL